MASIKVSTENNMINLKLTGFVKRPFGRNQIEPKYIPIGLNPTKVSFYHIKFGNLKFGTEQQTQFLLDEILEDQTTSGTIIIGREYVISD